jgi:predicted RNA polymerase sigma factor
MQYMCLVYIGGERLRRNVGKRVTSAHARVARCVRIHRPSWGMNRAVAIAMRDRPAAGLMLIDAILERGDLQDYDLAHSARADLARRLAHPHEARASYEQALRLARQEPERRFVARRLAELT